MRNINLCILTYNEESRIRQALEIASLWAKNIFIVDKSSTDRTIQIANEFGCKIIQIPFSPQGSENYVEYFDMVKAQITNQNKWIFWMTPGEIPSKKLIETVNDIVINPSFTDIDLIYIPIKLFTFGKVRNWGYWNAGSQPRLFNSELAIIQNEVHNHIKGSEKSRALTDSDQLFIVHPTHTNFSKFIHTHHDYALKESFGVNSEIRVQTAHQYAEKYNLDFFNNKIEDDIRPFYAWKIYCYMVALKTLDEKYGLEGEKKLSEYINNFRATEWGVNSN